MDTSGSDRIVIIGAGPAGLAAAYRLARSGAAPLVLEQRDRVGGLACTEEYRGFLFDMGGHRFFTKDPRVSAVWEEILGGDFILRRRLSRIYYKGRYFIYPLKPLGTLARIGPLNALRACASYLRWRLFPYRTEADIERWVTNRFGRHLFRIFFQSYTEKVWGIPCREISSVWAAQRIKNLSLKKTVAKMLSLSSRHIRTLIGEFHYPRKGPGMMWNAMKEAVEASGGAVLLGRDVRAVHLDGNRVEGVSFSHDGGEERMTARRVISTMPLTSLVKRLDPPPPAEVLEAADRLRWRDFITVCLIVDRPDLFPDQWIYVHDPRIRMGRIQNYKNWSPQMVPDPAKTGLGLEYFCTAGDALWRMSDAELLELGREELDRMGIAGRGDVIDGTVFRIPKAYPLYEKGYEAPLDVLRSFARGLENLQTAGRSGLFRYNNMDHSMISGNWAASNLTGAIQRDLWAIHEEEGYFEEHVE